MAWIPTTKGVCGRVKASVTNRFSESKPWAFWMVSMAGNMCAARPADGFWWIPPSHLHLQNATLLGTGGQDCFSRWGMHFCGE
jgi:hypothetical protein